MDEHSRHVSDNSISSKNYSQIVPSSSAPVKDPLRGIWKVEVKPGSQTFSANTFGHQAMLELSDAVPFAHLTCPGGSLFIFSSGYWS